MLTSVGLKPYKVVVPNTNECSFLNENPESYVKRVALEKCLSLDVKENEYLITADTIVTIGRKLLHKTSYRDIAKKNLIALSGRRHRVFTSFCVKHRNHIKQKIVKTTLKMKKLSEYEIDKYLLTNEWTKRAGSYSVQGIAMSFFPFISGCYSNVVGLPLPKLLNTLTSMQFPFDENVFRDNY